MLCRSLACAQESTRVCNNTFGTRQHLGTRSTGDFLSSVREQVKHNYADSVLPVATDGKRKQQSRLHI